ncbi:AAA family ATPase [Chryseobacterium taklimakanense]|uniref:AAA family ATPase n=2 Tax=Chryseobacterium taklimakanense TaxID=536441 RepID=A0A3G8WK82_9FLAO|nr:AAA family ATPase [Chryseobacterium taklimakanense]
MLLPDRPIKMSFDYAQIINFLRFKGGEIMGKTFTISDDERGIIFGLLAWFLNDELVAEEMGIDLRKGILLSGPIGCGKTTLMKIMRQMPFNRRNYSVISSREIVSEFMLNGYEVLETYSRGILRDHHRHPKNFCFDDLGAETTSKYFGNECNVMAEILLTRYDLYKDQGIITHATTNLTADELEATYGNRLRSRMREMFNLFGYDGTSEDKRK